jgi:hypothetical protein
MSLGAGIWSEFLQHGFFKGSTEKNLLCAKDSGKIAFGPIFHGMPIIEKRNEVH